MWFCAEKWSWFFLDQAVVLDSYQWYSNSAPLCKRKATKRRREECSRTRRDWWGGGQDKRRRAGWKRKDKIRAHCYQMWKQSLQWQWFWPPTWTSRPGFPLINTRKNKLKFESSYSSSGSQETLSTSVRRFILQQNANKTVPHLIAGSDTENGDWYCVQLWKDLMRQRCMRVGPVHACVRVCAMWEREGQDQKRQPFILIQPGQSCLHTRLKL